MRTNRYYATRPSFQDVVLTPNVGSDFQLGAGVDMSEPGDPVARPISAFTLAAAPGAFINSLTTSEIENVDEIENSDTAFFETSTVAEEARTLYAYFKASYKFASGSAAFSEAYAKKDTHRAVYVVIQNSVTGPTLQTVALKWTTAPNAENLPVSSSNDEVMSQFVADHGTHYIAAVNYGFRIAIRGSIETRDESLRRQFAAAMKAKYGGLKASGAVSSSEESTLKQSSVEIRAVVVSGGVSPTSATVLYGYDQISKFLADVKTGRVRFKRAPITANLNSYWHTLLPYPRCRTALAPFDGIESDSPFGVPSGTVIAWSPTRTQTIDNADGTKRLGVPPGWAICDGQDGTPDLRDRFIYGTSDVDAVLTIGGESNHIHAVGDKGSEVYVQAFDRHRHNTAVRGYAENSIVVGRASVLPPFVRLLYLMKL